MYLQIAFGIGLFLTILNGFLYWYVKRQQEQFIFTRCPILDVNVASFRCCEMQTPTCLSLDSFMWANVRSCEDSSMQQDRQYCFDVKRGTCCANLDGNNHCLTVGINQVVQLCGNCSNVNVLVGPPSSSSLSLSISKTFTCGRDDTICVSNAWVVYQKGLSVECWYDASHARLFLNEPTFWNVVIIVFLLIGVLVSGVSLIMLAHKGTSSFFANQRNYGSTSS